MKKICRWDPSLHNNKRCPIHSVRQSEDGLYEESQNYGEDWEPISSKEFDEMKESLENNEIDLNDLRIEFVMDETHDEKMGAYDKSTTVYVNDIPVVILSTLNEDEAIKELSQYLDKELEIKVTEDDIRNALIEVTD